LRFLAKVRAPKRAPNESDALRVRTQGGAGRCQKRGGVNEPVAFLLGDGDFAALNFDQPICGASASQMAGGFAEDAGSQSGWMRSAMAG
jgi:hypothetical protein